MAASSSQQSVGIERTLRALMRSKNPAATDVLMGAIRNKKSGEDESTAKVFSAISLGAVRAVVLRTDSEGHLQLAEHAAQLSDVLRAALDETVANSPMAKSLEKLIGSNDEKLSACAIDIALSGRVVSCLPAMVDKTRQASQEWVALFAQSALGLAQELYSQHERFLTKTSSSISDPAFARRASINMLSRAITKYADHRRAELIEGLLLLAPIDEPVLRQIIFSPQHAAHGDLLDKLRTSTSPGVARILAYSLRENSTRQFLLDLMAEREDVKTLGEIFNHLDFPVGLQVRENAARIERFVWLDDSIMKSLKQLNDHQKTIAMVLATASKSLRSQVAKLAQQMMNESSESVQLAACWAIERLPERYSNSLIQMALASKHPTVVAKATSLLQYLPSGDSESSLIEMLDHEDEQVRHSAQEALTDINYSTFRDQYSEMNSDERKEAGELTRKADANAVASLKSELNAAAVSRRLKGLEMIEVMGLIDTMSDDIIECVADRDVGVRVEATRLLGDAKKTDQVISALAVATVEKSPAVRSVAQKSAFRLDALDEIERLIEVLMLEDYR